MPLSLQVKLLRVLQERKVRPLGSNRDLDIDVRIISATHRDLPKAMVKNEFREDLYYRLNVVNLKIPALNERAEDIPLLGQPSATCFGAAPQTFCTQFLLRCHETPDDRQLARQRAPVGERDRAVRGIDHGAGDQ